MGCDETRVAGFRLGALPGKLQIHFHPLVEIAVGNVAKRITLEFRHPGGRLFDEAQVKACVKIASNVQPHHVVFGIKRITMIGFLAEMRGNLMKNFPIDAPVEKLPADVCEEQCDCIHRLAVRADLHHANTAQFHQPTGSLLVLILARSEAYVNVTGFYKGLCDVFAFW